MTRDVLDTCSRSLVVYTPYGCTRVEVDNKHVQLSVSQVGNEPSVTGLDGKAVTAVTGCFYAWAGDEGDYMRRTGAALLLANFLEAGLFFVFRAILSVPVTDDTPYRFRFDAVPPVAPFHDGPAARDWARTQSLLLPGGPGTMKPAWSEDWDEAAYGMELAAQASQVGRADLLHNLPPVYSRILEHQDRARSIAADVDALILPLDETSSRIAGEENKP